MDDTKAQACERCGRRLDPERRWQLGLDAPPDGRVERTICVVCAVELRRYLLEPLVKPAPAGDEAIEPDTSWSDRFSWRVGRALAYVGIAIGAFLIVTWLFSR